MNIRYLFLLFFSVQLALSAQFVAPYKDVMDLVHVFDDGYSNLLEPLPLKSFKVGKNAMLYSSPQGRLKAYYKGQEYKVLDNTPDYFTSDYLVGYNNFGALAVLYNDRFQLVDGLSSSLYWTADSLIVWNSNLNDTRVFYEGNTYTIEQWGVAEDMGKISDNIFAYIDRSDNFKIFYQGQQGMLEGYKPQSFEVNRDILMYKDFTDNFKVFCKGKSYETNIPYTPNYQTGEGFFVFYDNQSRLNVWYNGDVTTLSQSRPKELLVKENIIAFTDQGNNFYVWYKGKMEMLERFQPLSMKADNDLLVYQDQYGRLVGYYYGKQVPVSSNIVQGDNYNVYNEVVTFSLVRGETSIWCKGKTYTYR